MATVSYREASRVYPGSERPAVNKLNLEIEDGEFMVLVGPSGCGKSTSLRMLGRPTKRSTPARSTSATAT